MCFLLDLACVCTFGADGFKVGGIDIERVGDSLAFGGVSVVGWSEDINSWGGVVGVVGGFDDIDCWGGVGSGGKGSLVILELLGFFPLLRANGSFFKTT